MHEVGTGSKMFHVTFGFAVICKNKKVIFQRLQTDLNSSKHLTASGTY